MGKGHGYEIHKIYRELFPSATLRVMYYHLRKGLTLEEFKVAKVEKEEGNYSWGSHAEKTYYSLGPAANPSIKQEVKEFMEKRHNEGT